MTVWAPMPGDSLLLYKKPEITARLQLPFELSCSHSPLPCQVGHELSFTVQKFSTFEYLCQGDRTSYSFCRDGLIMSLNTLPSSPLQWWPSLQEPSLREGDHGLPVDSKWFPLKPFNFSSSQPLILKGFDKSLQLNIK